ncbi:MAG: hypothetical protein LBO62_01600 [Endomicrobium sp.]|jgi:methionine synthase II (cobalamin-independent)|nr:hypothetical protein [Endomicrobium sp.]
MKKFLVVLFVLASAYSFSNAKTSEFKKSYDIIAKQQMAMLQDLKNSIKNSSSEEKAISLKMLKDAQKELSALFDAEVKKLDDMSAEEKIEYEKLIKNIANFYNETIKELESELNLK